MKQPSPRSDTSGNVGVASAPGMGDDATHQTETQAAPTERVQRGAYTILWNHPVPGTLTVEVRGRLLQRLTPKARQYVRELLAQRGLTILGKSRGPYVWYTGSG
jgi:hypothetical protein